MRSERDIFLDKKKEIFERRYIKEMNTFDCKLRDSCVVFISANNCPALDGVNST